MRLRIVSLAVLMTVGLFALAGCRGISTPGERQARQELKAVAGQYRPGNQRPTLPELTSGSSLSNFLAFALLNSPPVEAAYYDWSASVENITVTRSYPDPQLTFQAYIQNRITSLMPGFFQQIPGPGKLRARARVASAESEAKYFTFESAVLQAAYNLKTAGYKLGLLDEQLRLNREKLSLLENQESAARARNEAGGIGLSAVLRLQSERDRLGTELANLEDSRRPLQANFKAALGLTPDQPDPPTPAHLEMSGDVPDADALLRIAFERNPQLKGMEADVRAAEAGIAVAYKERVPDFNVGLMADVKASPWLYWPQTSMSLPIWRDKLAAEMAQARANKLAAQARLKAGQIDLAVNFAEKSFAYRETGRTLALLQNQLIPQARQSLEMVRAGDRAGTIEFTDLIEMEMTLRDLELDEVEARTQREIALADLSLMVAGLPPVGMSLFSNGEPGRSASAKTSK